MEIQYELTDRLAFYLCGRKPGNQVVLGGQNLRLNWATPLPLFSAPQSRWAASEKAACFPALMFL